MGIIYNSLTPSEGLILSLDTANRRSYPGSGNTWFDLSGNNNHGTLTNGASLNTGPGGGMNFDGVNDYVAATRFPPTGQQAYSFWIKTTAINQSVVGFSDKLSPDGSSAYDRDFQIDSSGRLQFRMFDVTGSVSRYAISTATANSGNWIHCVGQFNGSSLQIYINGTLEASTAFTTPFNAYSTSFFLIGNEGLFRNYFEGQLDDIRIYNRTLSESEIRILFNSRRRRYGL